MNKILIIGSPGAGKSYFAKQLSVLINKPLYHLDNIYWNEDKTHIEHDELVKRLCEIMDKDEWIIDGNYNNSMEIRLGKADTVFYFDYPTEVCIQGITQRVGKKRDDIPWIEEEVDPEFLQFVTDFKSTSAVKIEKYLAARADIEVHRFNTRKDCEAYLLGLMPSKIRAILEDYDINLITDNHLSGDLVYSVGEEYILKVSTEKGRLARERDINDYLSGKASVSHTVSFADTKAVEFYLKTSVKGEPLLGEYLKDPLKVADLLAEAMTTYHSIDTAGCSIYNPDSEGTCMVHGDFCLPNILVSDGKLSGFIDTEASGLGDPWVDYAWCIWSYEFNLGTKEYTPYLLDKLGIEFDSEKFDKYTKFD